MWLQAFNILEYISEDGTILCCINHQTIYRSGVRKK